ncbi:MAG: succinate--CoA ligase subunit alpha [Deltaproteobacteria bacterium]|nr:succinate--CoA ligase subunit alpha [Deltaproteobacteria bacterium]MBW2305929.1 succinate--CoA ligase subunit alpha [Deltaproteobacteria bacterium]
MSAFVFADTPVVIQGITGREGMFWTKHMKAYGTNIVAGVTPGKSGESVEGIPVYDTVNEAMRHHTIELSVAFVPAAGVKDAVFESLDAGIRKMVTLADGIPLHDQMEIRSHVLDVGATVIGANCAGTATIGEAMLGFLPVWLDYVYKPGNVGVITRSGSLTNETTSHLVAAGMGMTTVFGVGGDPVPATRMTEVMKLLEEDPQTEALVIVGELGGTMEEEAAQLIESGGFTKPAAAFISGASAPPEKKMGHTGAIIMGNKGTVKGKVEALESVGVRCAPRPSLVPEALRESIKAKL